LPENLTIGGYLYIRYTEIKELPENLTIGGSLDISNTEIKELPENLIIGGYLDISNTEIKELPENLIIGGGLDISNTKIKELPENLTIGGYLYIRYTEIKELPENLTIGGSLFISNTKIKELPENLTIGGILDISNTKIKDKKRVRKNVNKLVEGYCKEKNYIYFDNILWGNVQSIKKRGNITIYKTPLGYCVEESKMTAHGKTLKQAMEDLTLKKLESTDVSEIIKEIKESGKVNRVQYRAITGACRLGTEYFCNKHKIQDLEEIDIEELSKILDNNEYGAERFWELIGKEG